jgi:DNA-binding transcriptional ArsR family regulator
MQRQELVSNFDAMEANLNEASQFLKAVASPHRLLILCTLADRERSVGELAQELGLRQATVSQHLARLRLDGIVATRREAQTIFYRLKDGPAEGVIQVLHDHFCTAPAH